MDKEEYIKNLKDGCGHLKRNENKPSTSSPDFTGYLKIDNIPYRIAVWENTNQHGTYFSMKATEAMKPNGSIH
jgi:hypothetical protein